jgi:hypothetical protein
MSKAPKTDYEQDCEQARANIQRMSVRAAQ